MVSKAYRKCLLLIEKMVKHGYGNQIDQEELEKIISMYIGADQRTVKKYVRVCVQLEFLEPHILRRGKVSVYKINLMKAQAAMTEVYGRDLRQIQLFPEKG